MDVELALNRILNKIEEIEIELQNVKSTSTHPIPIKDLKDVFKEAFNTSERDKKLQTINIQIAILLFMVGFAIFSLFMLAE